MNFQSYAHRHADLILATDDRLRKEIEEMVRNYAAIQFSAQLLQQDRTANELLFEDMHLDFVKRNVALMLGFKPAGFFGNDLLCLQAAAEVTQQIKAGVYICHTKAEANQLGFEAAKTYLQQLQKIITIPVLLIGLLS